jgi:hypothetical protein
MFCHLIIYLKNKINKRIKFERVVKFTYTHNIYPPYKKKTTNPIYPKTLFWTMVINLDTFILISSNQTHHSLFHTHLDSSTQKSYHKFSTLISLSTSSTKSSNEKHIISSYNDLVLLWHISSYSDLTVLTYFKYKNIDGVGIVGDSWFLKTDHISSSYNMAFYKWCAERIP